MHNLFNFLFIDTPFAHRACAPRSLQNEFRSALEDIAGTLNSGTRSVNDFIDPFVGRIRQEFLRFVDLFDGSNFGAYLLLPIRLRWSACHEA